MAYTDIDDPSAYFQTALYTGNGGTQSIVHNGNSDLQPDWVWCKVRSQGDNHAIFDSVRGGQKQLRSNTTGGELTRDNAISSFNSDGFTMGGQPEMNTNGQTYVTWNWKAGTAFSNDASSTSVGTIDSVGSVSQTSGFSICTYPGNGTSGATIKHGLSTAPKIIIIKKRSAGDNWTMLNTNISLNTHLHLNTTQAVVSDPMFTNTAPTTSVFTVDSDGQVNENNNTFVAYCFSEVKGYSKFGKYIGNGNANGSFVYTGFKPAFVMIKAINATKDWKIIDNKRNPAGKGGANPVRYRLAANTTAGTSDDGDGQDFTSQGFKFRTTDSHMNGSGTQYIYMAFAENSFVSSTGVPATAR